MLIKKRSPRIKTTMPVLLIITYITEHKLGVVGGGGKTLGEFSILQKSVSIVF